MPEFRFRSLWTGEGKPLENAVVRTDCGIIREIGSFDPGSGYDYEFGMPAFYDAHCHFSWMILKELSVDLSCSRSRSDLLDMVSESVRSSPTPILRGESWDQSSWLDTELPTLEELDSATGNTPVFLCRVCGHTALANSAMLELMEPDPAWIDRRRGQLREKAVLDFSLNFPPDPGAAKGALRPVVDRIHRAGATGICTVEKPRNAGMIAEAGIPLRVSYAIERNKVASPAGYSLPPAGMLKLFLDGSFGAGSASTCDTGDKNLLYDDAELLDILIDCGEKHVTPVLHAIGAGALSQLDRVSNMAFERLGMGFPVRVEHAEDISAAWPGTWDPRYHIFSMQPNFVENWQRRGGMYDRLIGIEHSRSLNPFKTILNSGFKLGFGSDSMPFDPLLGLRGAVDHRDPLQSLSTAEALTAYTTDSAGISGAGLLARPLEQGRPADMVFLSGNPFECFCDVRISGTLFNGEVVHREQDRR